MASIHPPLRSRWLVPAFVLLFLIISATSTWFYQKEKARAMDAVAEQLKAVSILLNRQITNWREERFSDAKVFASSLQRNHELDMVINKQPGANLSAVAGRLHTWAKSYRYHDTLIVDTQGLVAKRYDAKPGTTYLLRPDQHVVARWRTLDSAKLQVALARALGSQIGQA